jgi:hypothetical protein
MEEIKKHVLNGKKGDAIQKIPPYSSVAGYM